jgi:hypothetical protein
MPEPSAGQPTRGDSQDDKSGRRTPYPAEEGTFPRLQERTQTQLGFINSLLVTLAVGLIAFAANVSASSSELHRLGGRRWLLLAGLVVLVISVLSGLRLAQNRLASHRVTTRVARLRQLRERYVADRRGYELRRLGRQAVFFQSWAKCSWSKRPEKKRLRQAAGVLTDAIPQQYVDKNAPETSGQKSNSLPTPDAATIDVTVTELVEALRDWYDRADIWTWRWLKIQTGCFIVGTVCLFVVPVSFY